MFDEILDTKIKIKIAKFLAETKESLTVSDVARMLSISKSRASECLSDLHEDGFLERKNIGRSIIYNLASNNLAKTLAKSLIQDKALLSEIERTMIFGVKKLHVVSLVLFGSALKGLKPSSDVDFLLVYEKEIDEKEIYRLVGELTQQSGFHISILAMSLKEFRHKAKKGEEFILNVMATHKLIYGKELERLVW